MKNPKQKGAFSDNRIVLSRNDALLHGNKFRKESALPIISTFFGIIVRMYYGDHAPPHFHAEYQGQRATFTFDGNLLAGQIKSLNANNLIKEWASRHQKELMLNWQSIEAGQELMRIEPLE